MATDKFKGYFLNLHSREASWRSSDLQVLSCTELIGALEYVISKKFFFFVDIAEVHNDEM